MVPEKQSVVIIMHLLNVYMYEGVKRVKIMW